MKLKLKYLLFFCHLGFIHLAQQKSFNFSHGNCQTHKGVIYCYGIALTEKGTEFKIYQLNANLQLKDSFQLVLTKNKIETYLQISSDTLHGFLNIYLQKSNATDLQIIRFGKNFNLVANIEKVEIARLNNTSLFNRDVLYHKNEVYSLKTVSDTSGKQFYINKYNLKSTTENFDYSLVWQFPFERQNIQDAHLFYASNKEVLVFVHVSEGAKKGQWILKLNSNSGELTKATKINAKDKTSTLFYGAHFIESGNRQIHLIGQEFFETQVDLSKNKFQIADLDFLSIYSIELDSVGNFIKKQSYKVPINKVTSGVKKTKDSFILKFKKFNNSTDGDFSFETDIYKSSDQSFCFKYVNSETFRLKKQEESFQLNKTTISSNRLIEDYYLTQDKNDLNGKQCVDSLVALPSFFYSTLNFPVKMHFKIDSTQSPCWLLNKHSFQKNNVNYSVLHPIKKTYKIESVLDVIELKSPGLVLISDEKFLIFQQVSETQFDLNLFIW